MPDNGMITVYHSIKKGKRSMIGINPELGITTTENENGQIIIEGPNENLLYLAEIIMGRCK
jgi:hypothetical protein